jgi:MFS family permease
VRLHERLGPLAERDFRLLFSATMITTAGDRLGAIALAFAVLGLHGRGAVDLGIVLAARQVTQAAVVLFGGVLGDRLPRNLVLAGASLVQSGAQAATAALVLTSTSSLAAVVVAQVVYGAGDGIVEPAERGLVVQIVSQPRLQQANALQGLSRNVVTVLGYALGGIVVAAGSPGVALAVDAGTFVACALLVVPIRLPARAAVERMSLLADLRDGWREFSSRTWLWSSVVLYGVGNLTFAGTWLVLGPAIAKAHLGGAGAWAGILSAGGVGAIAGGLAALRYRPERPLLAACVAPLPVLAQMVGLALHVPAAALAALALVGGVGLAVHLTLWATVFQQNVPEHAQSRVGAYDVLGSFVLIPVGVGIAGPVAAAVGQTSTIWAATVISAACMLTILLLPSVRGLRSAEPAATAVA